MRFGKRRTLQDPKEGKTKNYTLQVRRIWPSQQDHGIQNECYMHVTCNSPDLIWHQSDQFKIEAAESMSDSATVTEHPHAFRRNIRAELNTLVDSETRSQREWRWAVQRRLLQLRGLLDVLELRQALREDSWQGALAQVKSLLQPACSLERCPAFGLQCVRDPTS